MLVTLAAFSVALLSPVVTNSTVAPGAPIAGRPDPQDPQARLDEAIERYQSAKDRLVEAVRACTSDDQRTKLIRAADWKPFLETFSSIAREHKGSDTAAEAWIWVVRIGKFHAPDQARAAVETLLDEYMASEQLSALVQELVSPVGLGVQFANRVLHRLVAESPVESVKNAAKLHLADELLGMGTQPEPQRDAARRMYTELREAFQGDADPLRRIERSLFELDHLQVGMTAPDFEAVDVDGVSFKLSDYRGKVVVLDFWGFW